jgi:YbbR domain-containing protein
VNSPRNILLGESMKWSEQSKFRSFFVVDWQKKLISLAAAIILWYWVNFPEYEELTFSSPIVYKNLPKDMQIIETYDTIVPVKVRGLKEKIKNLDFNKMVHFTVNLEKAVPGVNSYMIEIELSEPQPDVIFTPLKDRARLKIDRMDSKIVLIQPVTTGSPGDDCFLDDLILDRRTISIKGPQSILSQYNYLETVPISIEGATNDIVETVPINLPKFVTVDGSNSLQVIARIVKKIQDERTNP